MNREEMIQHIKERDQDVFDLIAKVIELINVIGWECDDTHTFHDGERWARFDPEHEIAQSRASKESKYE